MRKKTALLSLLALLAAMQSLWAQKISVTGQVTDIFGGSPLPGVAVLEKTGADIQSLIWTASIPSQFPQTRHWCSLVWECRNRP